MLTLITFDASSGVHYQSTIDEEVIESVRVLLPRDMMLMFTIEDEVDVLDADGNPIKELVL